MNRREFLSLAGAGALHAASPGPRACIVIWQMGGCSHLDTFDMKPSAPREIRGEFRPIRTSVPGIEICEHLPRIARQAHRFTIVRSMRSEETNHERARHYLRTGAPFSPARASLHSPAAEFADGPLARQCEEARRAVESGAGLAIVRHHGYDTHRDNFAALRDRVLPELDDAFPDLLADLDRRGMLDRTLVVVMGEFGRSPRINAQGGRDHHSRAWSVVLAGAGVPGGRIVGSTDERGEEVTGSPMSPEALLRTIGGFVRPASYSVPA